ncbi:NAD(+) kinase [candidate division KSB1 bacterium]|nr:NAD(+) kinase [candidate division KSB1 bacterium]NIR72270.1 NAD(+) kinase [candidate division KSB1 bacterium]NIS24241.1 NAD(+) kinase [candidate division KSB1 bacterium]NIT71155.1 NAD(+) kinase [candidate division KSB1 bacterium]NIU24860.1 NAD(+) kinase [candidate division KSB1 bacterium]
MTIGIIANLEKDTVNKIVPDFLSWLKKRGVEFFVEEGLARQLNSGDGEPAHLASTDLCDRCQMIISFGGDGTILSTARLVGRSGIPILGVKIGGMGFLAETTPDELYATMEEILKDRFNIVERMVLEAKVDLDHEDRYYALNDFVFDKGAVSRVIRIKTFIDEELLNTYIGDGLIISTPTGSTAYSLAANGPILLPSMEAIIINPISPHTLSARPVVIPGDRRVRVEMVTAPQEVMLSADGQGSASLSSGQSVSIQKADYRIKLVTYGGRTFYDVLHAKLNWGEDIRKD